ncbi:MAG: hypothetical protein ACFN39_07105, partial [Lacticaseibacillus rhamnosus]
YQVSRKTILAKSFVFGDAQPALEQQLQQLAQLFQKIDQINNDKDFKYIKNPTYQSKIATDIVNGLNAYFKAGHHQ